MVTGHWSLVTGHSSLVIFDGHWSLLISVCDHFVVMESKKEAADARNKRYLDDGTKRKQHKLFAKRLSKNRKYRER